MPANRGFKAEPEVQNYNEEQVLYMLKFDFMVDKFYKFCELPCKIKKQTCFVHAYVAFAQLLKPQEFMGQDFLHFSEISPQKFQLINAVTGR